MAVLLKSYVENENVEVERLQSIYSNLGFMGIPLVNSIFGSEGVFYVTASITIFNIFIWTHGVILMSGAENLKFKDIIEKLISPTIFAIIIGLLFFIFQIRVPDVVYEALDYIADLNTPFAMLIAGVTIGKTNIIKLFTKNLRTYYIAFIRLIIIPFVLLLLYIWLPINEMVKIVAIIMASSPTAASGALFAIKFNKNSVYAAEIFTVSTLFCILTIPLIVKIAELLA